jgi:alcohol dehydrogenase class IV
VSADRRIGLDAVAALEGAAVVAGASVAARAAQRFGAVLEAVPAGDGPVVAVGGGGLIDRVKAAVKRDGAPGRTLVAIPSLWGSGAERSPVIVLDAPDGAKAIGVDPGFVPDHHAYWPELAATVAADARRHGAADALAHALEAAMSPLADAAVKADAVAVLAAMLELDPEADADAEAWFVASGEACAIQARAGVGLVHGIAHTLEGPLRAAEPDAGWGHARIVAAVLGPVARLAARESPRFAVVAEGVEADALLARADALATPGDLERLAAPLRDHWRTVLRDPCTRTNGFLVRGAHAEALLEVAA